MEHVCNHTLRKKVWLLVLRSHEGYCHVATDFASFPSSVTLRYIGSIEEETNNVLKYFSVFTDSNKEKKLGL
ncbi:hypothetical protein QUF81_19370 [Peribacillus simplex]|uniref:hypothetical protein n=1 Tax=Peribacillus simplex TaxID=1478 RepID=UPI0025A28943|nr:hypothetical protein [Peribacillus simplex]MDM5295282.1 hypothetical protein [Peribacillus simplex]